MPFWSAGKLRSALKTTKLVEPYEAARVKCGAYELSLGSQVFITVNGAGKKQDLKPNEQISIPPGQFGFLLTEETVAVPDNVIGFISIKASVKFKGLVNVSGFHVDPGFRGRLKFSVYNAGAQPIPLTQGTPLFPLWFADMTPEDAEPYSGDHNGQTGISDNDVSLLQGELASPAALKVDIEKLRTDYDKKINALDHSMGVIRTIGLSIIGLIVGVLLKVGLDAFLSREMVPALQRESQKETRKQPEALPNGKSDTAPSQKSETTPPEKAKSESSPSKSSEKGKPESEPPNPLRKLEEKPK